MLPCVDVCSCCCPGSVDIPTTDMMNNKKGGRDVERNSDRVIVAF